MKTSRNEIDENKKNTKLLIAYFILIFITIGLLFDVLLYEVYNHQFSLHSALMVLFWFIVGASIYTLFSYFYMNFLMISSVQGQEIDEESLPEVYHIVEELALAARIPMPKVYVVQDPSPNAFATGRDPEHAAVSVTTGLLQLMNREELEAVIGHEISHIKNYDIRISTLSAALASAIIGIGTFLLISARMIFDGMFYMRDDDDDNRIQLIMGIFGLGIFLVGIIIKLIGIPLSNLIQLALSRQREYLADVSSTTITHNPNGMIKALEKLQNDETPTNKDLTLVRQLCLVTPRYKKRGKKTSRLKFNFDTHPALEDRIQRLKDLM